MRLRLSLVLLWLLVACGGKRGEGVLITKPEEPEAPPPVEGEGASAFSGISSLLPVVDGFDLVWEPLVDENGDTDSFFYEVFVNTTGGEIDFDSPAEVTEPGESGFMLRGLAQGTIATAAVRAVEVTAARANDPTLDHNEVILRGQVLPILYVDASNGSPGDGTSPESAFQSINAAVQAAFALGSANILIAKGLYHEQVALPGGIDLYGGFETGFPGPRDPAVLATILEPSPGAKIVLRVLPSMKGTILDGLVLEGLGSVLNGLEARDTDLCLVNTRVQRMSAEGIVLTSTQRRSLVFAHQVEVLACGAEGLEARGIFDAAFSSCAIAGNAHEGVEIDDLTVFPADLSTFRLSRCVLSDNFEEGADVDFNERNPLDGDSSEDGRVRLVVERCRFERNGTSGLLCDIDFDPGDEVEVEVFIRGSEFRAQADAGILLDADLPSLFVLAGNRTAANRGSGIRVTSEPGRATVLVANHYDVGSGIEGITSIGPCDLYLSHVAVAGASLFPVLGGGTTRFVNGAIWSSPFPSGTRVEFCYVENGFQGEGNIDGELQFVRAPKELWFTQMAGTRSRFPAPPSSGLKAGDIVEIDDDGVARTLDAVTDGSAHFSPAADRAVDAGALIARLADEDPEESFELEPASPWLDAGDPVELDGDLSRTDIGVRGGILQDFRSSAAGGLTPFVVERMEPGIGAAVGPLTIIEVRLSRDVDPDSVDEDSFRVRLDGELVDGQRIVSGRTLQFSPSAPIQSGDVKIEVHGRVADLSGTALHLPMRWVAEVR